MAQLYTKYSLQKSRRKSPTIGYAVLSVALVTGIGWIWWSSVQQSKDEPVDKFPASGKSTNLLAYPVNRSGAASKAVPQKSGAATRVASLPKSAYTTSAPPLGVIAPPNLSMRPAGSAPASAPVTRVQNVYEAQLALDRLGISSGSLDGTIGSQTRAALAAFQQWKRLPITGQLDAATKNALAVGEPAQVTYTITPDDVARLRPLASTWVGKSQQDRLDFENLLELVAEKSHAHPGFIRRINPNVNWTNLVAGDTLVVPNAERAPPRSKAAFLRIHLTGKSLDAFDANTNLLAHFPCSIAQRMEKRPVGELHVKVIAPNPNYTFDPAVFPESAEARAIKTKLVLPPGPNNPVGVAWIGLDLPGYGIHGTPRPEDVGRTESHGCFRLANWNAEYLLKLVWVEMPVIVEP